MSDLLDQMRQNPRAGWTIKDVETLCAQHGLICLPPRRGSHYKVKRPGVNFILTVPFHRPIKPVYVKRVVWLIDLKVPANEQGV